MKIRILLSIMIFGFIVDAFCQRPTIELTFTAKNNDVYVQLDSIKVMNQSSVNDTTLYWPDTVLILDYQVGISESNNVTESFQVYQNFPNPIVDHTTISLYIPYKDNVILIVRDILGQVIIETDMVLDKGIQYFQFIPGNENIYFFTAQWEGKISSIKMLQTSSNSLEQSLLEHTGSEVLTSQQKATDNIQSFSFSLGDELLYIGYTDTLQSGMLDIPEVSETYIFEFATNIPCPGTPTVTYEGQVYNTIQIFNQCWLKENLNVGSMISGNQEMSNNGLLEKYCHSNELDSCNKYGGLYQWWEMMQYSEAEQTQGICPSGWHIPTDEEWKILEGVVDSQFDVGDLEWDGEGHNGLNTGMNLKSNYGWPFGGNGVDKYGFSILSADSRRFSGGFEDIYRKGMLWSADRSSSNFAWSRIFSYAYDDSYRGHHNIELGFSVRCIKN